MLVVSHQVVVSRPSSEVWDFISDPANNILLEDRVIDTYRVPGTPVQAVGEQWCTVVRTPDGPMELYAEIVELEPGRRSLARGIGDRPAYLEVTVIPVDGGTAVLRARNQWETNSPEERAQYEALVNDRVKSYVTRAADILNSRNQP